jgi:beta-lactamase class D
MTKRILPHQTLRNGWQLFGKTGSGFEGDETHKTGWYVGWMERDTERYIFALLMKDLEYFTTKEERQKIIIDFFGADDEV